MPCFFKWHFSAKNHITRFISFSGLDRKHSFMFDYNSKLKLIIHDSWDMSYLSVVIQPPFPSHRYIEQSHVIFVSFVGIVGCHTTPPSHTYIHRIESCYICQFCQNCRLSYYPITTQRYIVLRYVGFVGCHNTPSPHIDT